MNARDVVLQTVGEGRLAFTARVSLPKTYQKFSALYGQYRGIHQVHAIEESCRVNAFSARVSAVLGSERPSPRCLVDFRGGNESTGHTVELTAARLAIGHAH